MARHGLTRDGIVGAAARVADAGGIGAVSMRNVGRELGVEAMSLYHHLPNKDALLDLLADHVFGLIEKPDPARGWRAAMTERALSVRAVTTRHPWSLTLMESRAPGPQLLRHHDAVLGCLLASGFPLKLAAQAFSLLDAYIYGFVLTEQKLPLSPEVSAADFVAGLDLDAAAYPHVTALIESQIAGGDYSYGDEFEPGLLLILDGLQHRLDATREGQ